MSFSWWAPSKTENFSGLRLASLLVSPPQLFCDHNGFSVAHRCDLKTATLPHLISVDGVAAIFTTGVIVLGVIAAAGVDAA